MTTFSIETAIAEQTAGDDTIGMGGPIALGGLVAAAAIGGGLGAVAGVALGAAYVAGYTDGKAAACQPKSGGAAQPACK